MMAQRASELFKDSASNRPVSPGEGLEVLQQQTHSSKTNLTNKGSASFLAVSSTEDLLPPSGDFGSWEGL